MLSVFGLDQPLNKIQKLVRFYVSDNVATKITLKKFFFLSFKGQ